MRIVVVVIVLVQRTAALVKMFIYGWAISENLRRYFIRYVRSNYKWLLYNRYVYYYRWIGVFFFGVSVSVKTIITMTIDPLSREHSKENQWNVPAHIMKKKRGKESARKIKII